MANQRSGKLCVTDLMVRMPDLTSAQLEKLAENSQVEARPSAYREMQEQAEKAP